MPSLPPNERPERRGAVVGRAEASGKAWEDLDEHPPLCHRGAQFQPGDGEVDTALRSARQFLLHPTIVGSLLESVPSHTANGVHVPLAEVAVRVCAAGDFVDGDFAQLSEVAMVREEGLDHLVFWPVASGAEAPPGTPLVQEQAASRVLTDERRRNEKDGADGSEGNDNNEREGKEAPLSLAAST